MNMIQKLSLGLVLTLYAPTVLLAADVRGANDPEGMRRFEGSEIIAYHAPSYDEFEVPLANVKDVTPTTFLKSQKVTGLVSRYTYAAPVSASIFDVFANYKAEFARLGLTTLYQKGPDAGMFYTFIDPMATEDGLNNLFQYSGGSGIDRFLVAKSADPSPTYYVLYVNRKGNIDSSTLLKEKQVFWELIRVAPKPMDNNMVFTSAEMSKFLADSGKVVLYGIRFDTDSDQLRPDSTPTLQAIAELLKNQPTLKLRVVGHTDDQGPADRNLDLSKRRAQSVVRELASKYGVSSDRLDSFGCGLYAPVTSNAAEEGRAKNRRVELLSWL